MQDNAPSDAEDRRGWFAELARTAEALLQRTVIGVFYEDGTPEYRSGHALGLDVHSVNQAVTFRTGEDECFPVLWTWYRGRNYDLDLAGPSSLAKARYGHTTTEGFEAAPRDDCSGDPHWAPFIGGQLRRFRAFATTDSADEDVLDAIELTAQDGTVVTLAARSEDYPGSPGMDHLLVFFGNGPVERFVAGPAAPWSRVVVDVCSIK
jgi:hypothetical protein